ncbi:hypothetical protein JM79_3196 [Gramella sp. Hel_I_59]|uniref:hypothetical protein n=1 Tax=Gramella sp. Hel_I_59 TaxID=1249978 RepID=UPI00114E540E|nr:hypothetical protein [Gramella sp. Hel_I_59]TQI72240.1 hypothetical protein JM79_3196 [Gramella sp. Hel_I_59]
MKDQEIQEIDASLRREERTALWLTAIALIVFFISLVSYSNDLKNQDPLKTKSPKRELQAVT